MVIFGGFLALASAQPAKEKHQRSSVSAKSLPEQVNDLALQLYGVQLPDAGAIPGQVQKLVIGSLKTWMSRHANLDAPSPYPPDVRVRMQLEHEFSRLRYPFFGRPVVFVRPWNGTKLIGVGYTFGWSDFDRVNVFALFQNKAGKTQMAALSHFVPYTDMHYAFLPASPKGDFRFLIYGNRLGMSQPRLSVILYSFDGKSLKNLWERQNLYDGKMQVTPAKVTLRYLNENEYVQAVGQGQLPPRHEAIYKVAPQGLVLETERRVPF